MFHGRAAAAKLASASAGLISLSLGESQDICRYAHDVVKDTKDLSAFVHRGPNRRGLTESERTA